MKTAVFTFATPNLGDEMQSLAVLAHLAHVDEFLDRDRLAECSPEGEVSCVFNSWFMLGSDFRLPCDRLRPIWHGFSGGRRELLQEPWLSYLRDQEPIGCRDLYTTDMLRARGIAADWTGCLTLFLGQRWPRAEGRRSGVLFVDVPEAAEAHIPVDVRRRAMRTSSCPAPGVRCRPLERWAAVARLVDAIARAELVVTRRLHVALPATSLGTPVVAIPDPAVSLTRERFSGFDTFLPTCYLDKVESGLRTLDWQHLESPRIPDALEIRYRGLCARLRRFGIASDNRPAHVLDRLDVERYQLSNASGCPRPGRLCLRLGNRRFELEIKFWSDRSVVVGLSGFPGLSKFGFIVEHQLEGRPQWEAWGRLQDVVVDALDRQAYAA